MPFTISHVAAVLPFSRALARWRVLSATVIGSMVPDFGFLMPWRPARVDTHGAFALLTFCVPVGLVTFWTFQQMIKTAVMEVLPDAAYCRWQRWAAPADIASVRQWILAAVGILAGALSHLIWDAFTHEGARGVRMIPALDDPILDFAGHHLVGARLMQDLSSLLGLAVVLLVMAYGLRQGSAAGETAAVVARPLAPAERYAWIGAYGLLAVLLAVLSLRRPVADPRAMTFMIGNYAVAMLRGFAAALIVVSVGLGLRLRARPIRPARNEAP